MMGTATAGWRTERVVTSLTFWVFVLTFFILAIHPIPECVACEFPQAWGRDDLAYTRDSTLLASWFILASLVAGFGDVKSAWLVPVAILMAHLLTQPIGGVPWWSLWANEGPMVLLLGIPTGAACLVVGHLLRLAVRWPTRMLRFSPP